MKFLSHHDLMRLFDRAMRRADLPIKFTEGADPRPILSFPVALSVGVESLDEVMQFELSRWVAPFKIRDLLNQNFPEGIRVLDITQVSRRDRFQVAEITLEIIPATIENLWMKISEIKKSRELKIKRDESKTVDVRPFILDISTGVDQVTVRVKITPTGTIRIDELLELLGTSIEAAKVTKTRTVLYR